MPNNLRHIKDALVPLNQSELLRNVLQKVEVSVLFQVIEGAGQGFGGQQIMQTVLAFFDKHLKAKRKQIKGSVLQDKGARQVVKTYADLRI